MTQTNESLLRLPAVLERVGIKRSTVFVWIKAGKFPAPIKLGERIAVWKLSEVNKFIEDSIAVDGLKASGQ